MPRHGGLWGLPAAAPQGPSSRAQGLLCLWTELQRHVQGMPVLGGLKEKILAMPESLLVAQPSQTG